MQLCWLIHLSHLHCIYICPGSQWILSWLRRVTTKDFNFTGKCSIAVLLHVKEIISSAYKNTYVTVIGGASVISSLAWGDNKEMVTKVPCNANKTMCIFCDIYRKRSGRHCRKWLTVPVLHTLHTLPTFPSSLCIPPPMSSILPTEMTGARREITCQYIVVSIPPKIIMSTELCCIEYNLYNSSALAFNTATRYSLWQQNTLFICNKYQH